MYIQPEPETILVNEPSLLDRGAAIAKSGVSWGAIFAGALAAAALSLILLILGTGLGLASVSPWAQDGVSAETFGISTIVWITFMSLAASGMGGYIAGRLRTRWIGIHSNEVFFRDTAHGFLAWCLATLLTASLLTSTIGALVGGTVAAGTNILGGASAVTAIAASANANDATAGNNKTTSNNNPLDYFIDSLFRPEANTASVSNESRQQVPARIDENGAELTTTPMTPANQGSQYTTPVTRDSSSAEITAEVTRIFTYALWNDKELPAKDVSYVAQLVAVRTNITPSEAERRVKETYARLQQHLEQMATAAKETAEKAREVSTYSSLWLFLSLLIGAFVASVTATFGGRQRDL